MIAQKVREDGSTQQVRAGQTDGGRKAESGINWDEDECGRGGGERLEFGECVGTALEVKASGG